jgi:hypothetical protein
MNRLEALELWHGLHHSALATHEGSRKLVMTGTGFLTLGTATSSFTLAGGDTATNTLAVAVLFND